VFCTVIFDYQGQSVNAASGSRMSERLNEIRDGMFFIVGPHRGGTTLLQAMLSTHSQITIPPETEFFDQVWPRQRVFGSLTNPQNLRRLGQYLTGPHCSVSDLGLKWEDITQGLSDTKQGYDDLFAVILALYGDSRGKRRVGEKSPQHIFDVGTKLRLYPQAKFLCLMRDPRAVVRSEMETTWGSKSVGRITRRWERVAREAQMLRSTLSPSQLCFIRYEDLVRDPEPILRKVCEFLGERFESEMLKFHDRSASEQGFRTDEVWKFNTLRPVDPSRIDQWRDQLTPGQIVLIEQRAGDWLERSGYTPSGVTVSRWRYGWEWLKDRGRWGWEVLRGMIRGRSRRRPWSSVWAEVFSRR
jgi:hypothetical protein